MSRDGVARGLKFETLRPQLTKRRFSSQELVNTFGGPPAVRNHPDDQRLAARHVASGEDLCDARLKIFIAAEISLTLSVLDDAEAVARSFNCLTIGGISLQLNLIVACG